MSTSRHSRRTSAKQIRANRLNAQKSTGPVTQEGKEQSRRNALRHGLLACTIQPVPEIGESADELANLAIACHQDFDPKTAIEKILVGQLINLTWRLQRAQQIEAQTFEKRFKETAAAEMLDDKCGGGGRVRRAAATISATSVSALIPLLNQTYHGFS